MTVVVADARPRGIDVPFRPGNPLTVNLTWPAGELTGRTFTSTIDGVALALAVNGDVMTIEATEAQTTTVDAPATWLLTETTGGASPDLLIGTWSPSTRPGTADTLDFTVTVGTIDVAVTVVSGQASIVALDTRTTLESVGAVVDQAAARTLEARWLAFIRSAGSGSPGHASWQYLGGDVTDAFVIPTSDDVLWIGADWYDGTTVNASDLYVGDALPVRNGAVQEATPGTFAVQFHRVGNTGVWLDAVADGGQASGRIWWPLCIMADGGTTMRVGCLLVNPAIPPYGEIEASHIVTLNAFGLYGSHINVGISGFEIDGMWRDTTHTYIIDERSVAGELGSKHTRLARVTNGSLLTVASWQHWDGTTWGSSAAAAAPIEDTAGNVIVGDLDIAKITDGHYLLVNHFPVGGTHLDVYRAAQPEGPWAQTARVPLPSIGHTINGGEQITQIPRILEPAVLAGSERPPAEHSMVLLSRNVLDPTEPFTARNIRRYAPQFVAVPQL